MEGALNILICEHFRKEAQLALDKIEFRIVNPVFFPARCGRPPISDTEFKKMLGTSSDKEDVLLIGCACLFEPDILRKDDTHFRIAKLKNCFQLFLGEEIIDPLINEGAFLITPGWLADWQKWIDQWGGAEYANEIFNESVSKLVLLETYDDPDSYRNLNDLASVLKKPFTSIKSGIDYFGLFLENEVLKWRLSLRESNLKTSVINTGLTSDYAMAMDLLSDLPYTEGEEAVVQKILELLTMLFAPGTVKYLSVNNGNPDKIWTIPDNHDRSDGFKVLDFCNEIICPNESGTGFRMVVGQGPQKVAIIELDDFVNPEYISHYQNLCISMAGVFVLAIENSRFFQKLSDMLVRVSELNNTKDKFFSIIAHDLKNPFVTILGFSELLKDNFKSMEKDEVEENLKIISETSKAAYDLCENLLLWAKSQRGLMKFSPQELCLKDCIAEIISLLNGQASKKGITLFNNIDESVKVEGDMNMISTIIRNLAGNSIKFTDENGSVNINCRQTGDMYEISVTDSGVGISSEDLTKLFRIESVLTTTGTRKEKGTGLGLIICKEFVEKHGGKIWAESHQGKGSKFCFTLPLVK